MRRRKKECGRKRKGAEGGKERGAGEKGGGEREGEKDGERVQEEKNEEGKEGGREGDLGNHKARKNPKVIDTERQEIKAMKKTLPHADGELLGSGKQRRSDVRLETEEADCKAGSSRRIGKNGEG